MGSFASLTHGMARPRINFSSGTNSSVNAFSLNGAAVIGTSGPIIGIRYVAAEATPITALYLFLHAVGGTIGNITMQAAICNEGANGVRSGTTVRATSTATFFPASTSKWIKFAFGTPYTPALGEILWLDVYNTSAAPATDYPQIRANTICSAVIYPDAAINSGGLLGALTNAAGFSTNGTFVSKMPFVVAHGSNVYGNPFTTALTNYYANNTLERGIVFTPIVGLTIAAMQWNAPLTNYNGINFYADATAPGGSTVAAFATGTDTNQTTDELIGAKLFSAPVSLGAGATYKATLTFGAASQNPSVQQIEDYATYPAVFDAFYDGFNRCYSAIDNGSGGWTLDKSISPDIELVIGAFAAASGGISRGRLVNA